MNPSQYHPVEWFNINGIFKDIFQGDKNVHMINDSEAAYNDPEDLDSTINKPTFKLVNGQIQVLKNNPQNISSGLTISKFTLLTAIKFKGDFRGAESYVMYQLMNIDLPYVRIGTDYYAIEKKPDRYGGKYTTLKVWKKDTITEDHTKNIIKLIPKYQDFIIAPDNINYSPVHGRYYNLYSEFPHKPSPQHVSISQIPTTIHLLKHIFGEQFELGMKYMKVLYEFPKQILPILVLVSEERETGKTTFLNYISMLFGDNSILINPSDLLSNFNSSYATKNIILVDEAFVEKGLGVEKLKSIATAKKMSVNPKHVQGYSVDFYGKVIMCSNKERDFMRIDDAEIRFFIRKIKTVNGNRNVNIETDLYNEIPYFIKYITQLPQIDFSKSRMVFTKEEIQTEELKKVKENSRVTLFKDLNLRIRDMFFENPSNDTIYATAVNLHDRWWHKSSQISPSYIKSVLDEDFKMPKPTQKWYFPFNEGNKIKNRPYKFERIKFLSQEEIEELSQPDQEEVFDL